MHTCSPVRACRASDRQDVQMSMWSAPRAHLDKRMPVRSDLSSSAAAQHAQQRAAINAAHTSSCDCTPPPPRASSLPLHRPHRPSSLSKLRLRRKCTAPPHAVSATAATVGAQRSPAATATAPPVPVPVCLSDSVGEAVARVVAVTSPWRPRAPCAPRRAAASRPGSRPMAR